MEPIAHLKTLGELLQRLCIVKLLLKDINGWGWSGTIIFKGKMINYVV